MLDSRIDSTGVEDLVRQLATIEVGAPRIFEAWLPALREVLGLDKAVLYELRAEDAGSRSTTWSRPE